MTQDEKISQLKEQHDKLQEGLASDQMAIRDGIVVEVGEGAYDSYPRYGFHFFCFRNPDCVTELDRFIQYAKGKENFWDIGAFHGIFSLVFQELNPEGSSLAIEPMPSNFNQLAITCANKKIDLLDNAIGDEVGEIEMIEYGGHYQKRCGENDLFFKVKCFPADNLVPTYGFPDIVKVDVEGNELKVLKGMRSVLKYGPTIFLELHCGILTDEEKNEIVMIIEKFGYLIIDCESDLPIDGKKILDQKQGELRIILK